MHHLTFLCVFIALFIGARAAIDKSPSTEESQDPTVSGQEVDGDGNETKSLAAGLVFYSVVFTVIIILFQITLFDNNNILIILHKITWNVWVTHD